MLGNFVYYNPTKLYFGEDSLNYLEDELKKYGPTVMLTYGSGSIKKNGIYDKVIAILHKAGKKVVEDAGIMTNPTLEKLIDGVNIARKHDIDLILSVGGGSVCDYSKALSASVYYDGDLWDKYFIKNENPDASQKVIPIGCILTMAGTGSEMNSNSVITDAKHTLKLANTFDERFIPKFSILNPVFTYTVPQNQMKAGIYDIMSHIMEQYFSDNDDNTSDYISEGLMRGLINASRKAVKNPEDYEARSNIMWTATWALNTLIGLGKAQDWEVHMIGHAVGANTHAPHGYALASVSLPYYNLMLSYGLPKFKLFAENVWNVNPVGKTDLEIAKEGLDCLKNWMLELGIPTNMTEIGATPEMIDSIVKGTVINDAGYHKLTPEDLILILKESL